MTIVFYYLYFEQFYSLGKDETGKFIIETDANDVLEVPCEWVVQAIGQSRDDMWKRHSPQD